MNIVAHPHLCTNLRELSFLVWFETNTYTAHGPFKEEFLNWHDYKLIFRFFFHSLTSQGGYFKTITSTRLSVLKILILSFIYFILLIEVCASY